MECRGFAIHHVLVEGWRATNGLAGVVDYEIETVARAQHLGAERLDAGSVAQVESVNGEAIAPLREVRFLYVASGGIARKTRRDYEVCTCTQQLDASLISDLDASAGDEGDAAAQIGRLRTLRGNRDRPGFRVAGTAPAERRSVS